MATLWDKATAESGNTTAFDNVTAAGSNTFTASTAQHYEGSYAYCAHGVDGSAFADMTYTGQDEIYEEFYVYIPSTLRSSVTWSYILCSLIRYDAYTGLLDLYIETDGDGVPFRWTCIEAGWASSTTNFATDQWIKIEMYWHYVGAGSSVWWIKAGGSTIYSSSTATPGATTCTFSSFGMDAIFTNGVGDLYFDNIRGHDQEEAEPEEPSGGSIIPVIIYNLQQQGML
jgi:hypothetical protein